MKNIWENKWFFIPVALFFGFCSVLILRVPYSHEILFFNNLRHEPFNALFQAFTYCGEAWAYLVFGVALLFWRPKYALIVGVLGLLQLPLMYVIKDAIGVDRPITYFEKRSATQMQPILVPNVYLNRGQTSFPSGHTVSAFALYSLLALMTGRRYAPWGLLFAILAILTGISRIFFVQHFLADVMGGALLGLLLSGLIWQLAGKVLKESAD